MESYDSIGRRAYKKVTVNGEVTLHQRYLYRGYLQISCVDLTRSHHPCLWLFTWDPTQSVASRPLAVQKDGTWFTYGIDISKNICELFGNSGYINTTYTYSPFGAVTSSGNSSHPIQWSSEFYDAELGMVYYNYRFYNPLNGRWTTRDRKSNNSDFYIYLNNATINRFDYRGDLWPILAVIVRVAVVAVAKAVVKHVAKTVTKQAIKKAVKKGALEASKEYGEQVILNQVNGKESPWVGDINWGAVAGAGVGEALLPERDKGKIKKRFTESYEGSKNMTSRINRSQRINPNKPLTPHNRKVVKRKNKKIQQKQHYEEEMKKASYEMVQETAKLYAREQIKEIGSDIYDDMQNDIEKEPNWGCNSVIIQEDIKVDVEVESTIEDKGEIQTRKL